FSVAGDSQLAMISNLNGKFNFLARDGMVRGFDTERLSLEVASLIDGTGAIEAIGDARRVYNAYLEEGETKYTRINADFTVTSGRAVTKDAVAELAASGGSVDATFDLPRWTMDANLKFRLTGDKHQQTPPVGKRVWGPIDDPQEKTDIGALTQFVGKKLANRVLKDVFSGEGTGDTALRRLLGGGPQTGEEPQPLSDGQQGSQGQKVDPLNLIFNGIMNQVREDRKGGRKQP
ncbi:MAG: hypothetical protein O2910_08195, partial [Proteobacteria bacterium]|nr:hypothetical protein [Pseudomonadota bacterium]